MAFWRPWFTQEPSKKPKPKVIVPLEPFMCAAEAYDTLSPVPKVRGIDLSDGRELFVKWWSTTGDVDAEDWGKLPVEIKGYIKRKGEL